MGSLPLAVMAGAIGTLHCCGTMANDTGALLDLNLSASFIMTRRTTRQGDAAASVVTRLFTSDLVANRR